MLKLKALSLVLGAAAWAVDAEDSLLNDSSNATAEPSGGGNQRNQRTDLDHIFAGVLFSSIAIFLIVFFFRGDDMVDWLRHKLEQYELTAMALAQSFAFGFCFGTFPIWIPGVATFVAGGLAKVLGYAIGPTILGKKLAIPFWALFLLPFVRIAEWIFGLEEMEIARLQRAYSYGIQDALGLFGLRLLVACAVWVFTIPIIYMIIYYMMLPLSYAITGEGDIDEGIELDLWEDEEEGAPTTSGDTGAASPTLSNASSGMSGLGHRVLSAVSSGMSAISPRSSGMSPRGSASPRGLRKGSGKGRSKGSSPRGSQANAFTLASSESKLSEGSKVSSKRTDISTFTDVDHSMPPWMGLRRARLGDIDPVDENDDSSRGEAGASSVGRKRFGKELGKDILPEEKS